MAMVAWSISRGGWDASQGQMGERPIRLFRGCFRLIEGRLGLIGGPPGYRSACRQV